MADTPATPRKRHARRTPKYPQKGPLKPSAAQLRILHAALELLSKTGWPSMAAIGTALNIDRTTVGQHFENERFAAWFNERCEKHVAIGRSRCRAKFATLAMAGSVPHAEFLGWSEAKRVTVHNDGTVELPHDGPIPIVINSLIPRPPA